MENEHKNNVVFSLILNMYVAYEGCDVKFLGTFRSLETLLSGFVTWVEADGHPALTKEISSLNTVEEVNEVLERFKQEFGYSYDCVCIEVSEHKLDEVILPNAM